MAPFRTLLLSLLLLSVALTGCFGGGGDDPDPGDSGDDPPQEGKGSVEGRVVRVGEITPIRGAIVSLIEGGESVMNTTTDAQGEFRLRNVEPGQYRLHVTALCCKEGLRVINVLSDETLEENFMLEPHAELVIQDPFVDTDGEWRGLITCAVAADGQNPMFPGVCQYDPEHSHRHIAVFGPGVRTITIHLEWQPAGIGLGGETLRFTAANLNAGLHVFADVEGTSPLEIQVHNRDIEDEDNRFDAFDAGWVGRFQVEPVSDSVDVLYYQEFRVIYHVHYWEGAESGYSAAP